MTYSTWKTMRSMNTHKTTKILEKLEQKIKFKKMIEKKMKMIEKKMKNDMKVKRRLQFGIRSVHKSPDRFVACPAVDVMKYGVERTCWV